jgi:hypothetical protein
MRDDEMTDAALDEEIAQALSVDPSPELLLRIRRRIETAPVPGVWTGSWLTWSAAASGAAVAAAIAFVVARHGGATTASVPPLMARTIPYAGVDAALGGPSWRGVTVPVTRVGTGMRDANLAFSPSTTRLEPRATARADSAPEILVDPREARALRSFIDGVGRGRLDLTGLLDATIPPVMVAEPIRDIYIAPIEWPPLIGGEQGVPR